MTVRYSDAQLQQQRDLPGAGVRRQAVDPQHIEWIQRLCSRGDAAEGEIRALIGGNFGSEDPLGQRLAKWLTATLTECLGEFQYRRWSLQANRDPWHPHADQSWHETLVPKYTVLIPLTAGPRTCVFHQRVLDAEPWGRPQESKDLYQVNTPPQASPGYEGHSPGHAFTVEHHTQHYAHTDYAWFEGLTVDMEYQWQVGDIIWWPSVAIHCSDDHTAQGIPVKHSVIVGTWFV